MQVIRDYFLSILNDSNAMIAQGLGLIAVIITFFFSGVFSEKNTDASGHLLHDICDRLLHSRRIYRSCYKFNSSCKKYTVLQ